MDTSLSDRVLLSLDLLPDILSHLSTKDLLFAQKVCRFWRDSITSVEKLQVALYLRPDWDKTKDSLQVEVNPLLKAAFPSFFDGETHFGGLKYKSQNLGPWTSTKWYIEGYGERQNQTVRAAFARPNASWRRMSPCRPAPTEVQARYELSSQGGTRGTAKQLLARHGGDETNPSNHKSCEFIDFGTIYDIVEDFWFHSSSPWVITHKKVAFSVSTPQFVDPRFRGLRYGSPREQEALKSGEYYRTGFVVLELTSVRQCVIVAHRKELQGKELQALKGEFRSQGSVMEDIVWNSVGEY